MRFHDLINDESVEEYAARLREDLANNDHLGKAATAKDKAREAEKAKDHDAAWGFYHEQKA